MESLNSKEKQMTPLQMVKWKYGALAGLAGIALSLCQYIFKMYPTPILSYCLVIGTAVIWSFALVDYREQSGNRLSFRKGWGLAYTVASIGHCIQLAWLLIQAQVLLPDSKELYVNGLNDFINSYLPMFDNGSSTIAEEAFWIFQAVLFVALWIFYMGPTMIIAAFLKRG